MTNNDDDMLEGLFAAAKSSQAIPDEALTARILGDAQTLGVARPMHAAGPWARILDMVGGWPAAGGLVAATLTGVWIGLVPPAGLSDMTAQMMGDAVTIDLFADTDLFNDEGLQDG